jgi:hypothetical protein
VYLEAEERLVTSSMPQRDLLAPGRALHRLAKAYAATIMSKMYVRRIYVVLQEIGLDEFTALSVLLIYPPRDIAALKRNLQCPDQICLRDRLSMTTDFSPNPLTGDAGQHYYEADSSKRRQSIVLVSRIPSTVPFLFVKKSLTLSYAIRMMTLLLTGPAPSTVNNSSELLSGRSYMGFPMELWSSVLFGIREKPKITERVEPWSVSCEA